MIILIYLLLVIITYYSIRTLDEYISKKKQEKWNWDWKMIILTGTLSLFAIIGFIIVLISEIDSLVKLPKNPPKWL